MENQDKHQPKGFYLREDFLPEMIETLEERQNSRFMKWMEDNGFIFKTKEEAMRASLQILKLMEKISKGKLNLQKAFPFLTPEQLSESTHKQQENL